MKVGCSAALADFVATAVAQREHASAVRAIVLDTVGAAAAAASENATVRLRRWLSHDGGATATLWADGGTTSPEGAALFNGSVGHLMEIDDVSPSLRLHPSVVLLPALVSEAERQGASWAALTDAYVVGAAAMRAIAELLPGDAHYARGWHSTGTIGSLASACAVARLRGLTAARTRWAIGIAGSLASGLRSNFGSMTKALHAGWAAQNGVVAAGLANEGFTANDEHLEAPAGFFSTYGDGQPVDAEALAESLTLWSRTWPEDTAVKRHPSCYDTHQPLDGLLVLRARGLDPRRIQEVSITLHPGATTPLFRRPPSTGLEAKFSLEYVTALCLLEGAPTFSHFTDEEVHDAGRIRFMKKVNVDEAPEPPFGGAVKGGYAAIEVRLTDGTMCRHRQDHTVGDGRHPLSIAELDAKFRRCASWGKVDWDAQAVSAQIRDADPQEPVSLRAIRREATAHDEPGPTSST